jgi:hypothetical protein
LRSCPWRARHQAWRQAAYSAKLDPARFVTIGLNDVRMGEKVIGGVRLADMLVELGKLKLNTPPFRRTVESAPQRTRRH